jgi:hypothetical protein
MVLNVDLNASIENVLRLERNTEESRGSLYYEIYIRNYESPVEFSTGVILFKLKGIELTQYNSNKWPEGVSTRESQ